MKGHRTSKPTFFVLIAVILVLILNYIGAYLMLVQPMPPGIKTFGRPYPRLARYRHVHSQEALDFFGPVNWIDRRIRRDMWTTPEWSDKGTSTVNPGS